MSGEAEAQHDVARRLLGPEGPEVGCDECFEQLDRFVELELSAAAPGTAERQMPELHAHLEGCPACREEYESLRALVRSEGSET